MSRRLPNGKATAPQDTRFKRLDASSNELTNRQLDENEVTNQDKAEAKANGHRARDANAVKETEHGDEFENQNGGATQDNLDSFE